MSDLFSGVPVTDFKMSLRWYQLLFGKQPDFFPHETEAVWKLAEHQYVYIVQTPKNAGHAILMQMVDSLDSRIEAISERGLKAANRDYFPNEICKVTYCDPDGNEISFGGTSSIAKGDA